MQARVADLSWGLHWTVGNINTGALHATDRVVSRRVSEVAAQRTNSFSKQKF